MFLTFGLSLYLRGSSLSGRKYPFCNFSIIIQGSNLNLPPCSYFRHYLNIWILWSVWAQFDLIRPSERSAFDPLNDNWLSWWMKWQIFTPIFLLQLINLFWYFLIWRILVKAVFYRDLKDERSDDEEEEDEVKVKAE